METDRGIGGMEYRIVAGTLRVPSAKLHVPPVKKRGRTGGGRHTECACYFGRH
jgi:hypothetical protein